MKFFAAIVLLAVPLVMADNTVDSGTVKASPKDEAHALYDDIDNLYISQMKIAQGHYADAWEQIRNVYGAEREDRWYTMRNATINAVTSKVERVITDALNIGVDVRNVDCYLEYRNFVEAKRQEKPESAVTDCVYVAHYGEVSNLDQIQNFVWLEIYSRIQSTARNELATCDSAANADPCYNALIELFEMYKGRLINVASEIRVVYATELAGHVDGCDSSVVLSLTEWQTQTLKYITSCANNAIRKVIGERNVGKDV